MPEKSEKERTLDSIPKGLKKVNWKKVGLRALLTISTIVVFCLGYFGASFWDRYFNRSSYATEESFDEDWQVYKSDIFAFGFRYPTDWEAEEVGTGFIVLKPVAVEGEQAVKEYISLKITATGSRAETSCEKDQMICSFYTNGIFGDRTITPDEEVVFFSSNENDFNFTLHKYGGADLVSTFESISQSFRFVSASDVEEENAETT